MSYSPNDTVDSLFDEQARLSPDAVALVVPAGDANPALQFTYGEIRSRATRLASRLRGEGVGAGQYVAVLMQRSPEMIVAILAILKAGAAYVPLDPTYPRERLEFLMADAGARVCITQPAFSEAAARLASRVLVEDASAPLHVESGDAARSRADSAAYVMYTSGSTGRPKGVVVPHRAIVRLVRGQTYVRLDSTRTLLHLAPPSFDAATFEVWGALLNGGRCVLAPEAAVPDLTRLREVIAQAGVTTLWLTASLFNTIIDHSPATLEGVAEVITGGEALSVTHARRAQELLPATQLINGYGPTESTTFACCFRIPRPIPAAWRSIPIGPPIAHSSAHVLDAALRDVPPGEAGDLYIGGDGLAIGYLNRPELTAERFIASATHGRLYRTGDRARAQPDGSLDFLGRDDDQVKIRGYRVELGEIETALRSLSGIGNAVVTLREDVAGDKRLVAYYTLESGRPPQSPQRMRQLLAERLPEYMVPSAFAAIDAIPLTSNGKVDRRALPAPGRSRPIMERPAVAARTAIERWVAGLWREVLQLDEVGAQDRFFDLGGTSITAMRFLARLNEETAAPLPVLLLFRAPTVAELSQILEREYRHLLPRELASASSAPAAGSALLVERAAQRQNELLERRLRRRAT